MSNLRLLYKSIAFSLNEICSLIISGQVLFQKKIFLISCFFIVTFCMLLFGILMYIIDNSEPESNTRNILGNFYSNLIFNLKKKILHILRWILACFYYINYIRLRRYLSSICKLIIIIKLFIIFFFFNLSLKLVLLLVYVL
jgi:hypothetical protein